MGISYVMKLRNNVVGRFGVRKNCNLRPALWLGLNFLLVILIFRFFGGSGCNLSFIWDFGRFSRFPLSVPIVIDTYSIIFNLTVTIITFWVCFFSEFYIGDRARRSRFMIILMLFVIVINFLIFIPNALGILIGWDGLGVVSFLLVIYYDRREALGAGIITGLTNRIGDACFLLFLAFGGNVFGWRFWDFSWRCVGTLVCLLLVLGRITKSAQVPFSRWLPAAIAAPTPVSTLVHSSTLVTAGVYVLIRYYEVIQGVLELFVGVRAIITLLMAGFGASVEKDLKKVVALSTLRQLGAIVFSLSLGAVNVCFFHLIVHAYFKASMFLCVGVIIHVNCGVQDCRFIGGIWYKVPVVRSWFVICNACLIGLPFSSGFYSKDLIIEMCTYRDLGIFSVTCIYLSVFLTAFYSIRSMWVVCWKESLFPLEKVNDWGLFSFFPITVLRFNGLLRGYIIQCVMLEFRDYTCVSGIWKGLVITLVLIGILSGLSWQVFKSYKYKKGWSGGYVGWFFKRIWFLAQICGESLGKTFLKIIIIIYRSIEGFIEQFWSSKAWDFSWKKVSTISRKTQLICFGHALVLRIIFVVLTYLVGI